MAKNAFEVCGNCGRVADKSDYKDGEFLCSRCGCNVSVVLPRHLFLKLIKSGFGKTE
ncbi:hypothetical protein H0O02_02320 [Candidatus Micrarchaeota archaeon]|nr:hypothetical protein [Candidatus Micrarchaeota archaeon]